MQLADNTVLVTGGASGIGLALAERFLAAGNTVVICGRREDALRAARERHPAFHVRVADLGDHDRRAALVDQVVSEFPALNVLVNNAGIQRRVRLSEPEPWDRTREEIAINLEAPVHLSMLL